MIDKDNQNNEISKIMKEINKYTFKKSSNKNNVIISFIKKIIKVRINIKIFILFILFLLFCIFFVIEIKSKIKLIKNNNKEILNTIENNNNSDNNKLIHSDLLDLNVSKINNSNFSLIINTTNNNINQSINDKNLQYNNYSYSETKNDSTNKNNEELIFPDMTTSYRNAQDFLKKGINGIWVNKNNYTLSDNPKISVVIPLYNCRNFILRAIRSVQNQNMNDIEIILVDDLSRDNILSYVDQLQQEDSRIKIIKNKKNMGTLYSRSIGVLSAKGEYIFSLDNDDMFLDYDLFTTVYNIAKKDNFDIVEFKGIRIRGVYNLLSKRLENTYFSGHKPNLVLYQPELGNYPLYINHENNEFVIRANYLWNKCIKTQIYQKGLNLFGEERYKRYMSFHEDFIIILIIFNLAESFKFIGKYGYVNILRFGSASYIRSDKNLLNMYLIDVIIDFSINTFENKKVVAEFLLYLLNDKFKETINKNEDNKKLFISITDRILSCKYISEEDKNKIKNKLSNFNL